MSWADQTLYALDVESTGVDVFTDRIVTATVVKLELDAEPVVRTWLLDPQIEIPEGATKVHGVTTAYAREHGANPVTAVAEIADTVAGVLRAGCPLVAFNAAYDLSILEAEAARHTTVPLTDLVGDDHWATVIDPFVLGKGLDHIHGKRFVKGRKYKLPDLCARYKVPFTESHQATEDAVGAAQLARAIARDEPYVGDMGPATLTRLQTTWRRDLQASLRRYFDANGIDHDGCDGGWPLHTSLTRQAVSA